MYFPPKNFIQVIKFLSPTMSFFLLKGCVLFGRVGERTRGKEVRNISLHRNEKNLQSGTEPELFMRGAQSMSHLLLA